MPARGSRRPEAHLDSPVFLAACWFGAGASIPWEQRGSPFSWHTFGRLGSFWDNRSVTTAEVPGGWDGLRD